MKDFTKINGYFENKFHIIVTHANYFTIFL